MKKVILLIFILIVFIYCFGNSSFRIKLEAGIDKETVDIEDRFTLTIKIMKTGSEEVRISTPNVPQLDWADQVIFQTSSTVRMLQNEQHTETEYKFQFKPKMTGKFSIPEIRVPCFHEIIGTIELISDEFHIEVFEKIKPGFNYNYFFLLPVFVLFIMLIVTNLLKKKQSNEHAQIYMDYHLKISEIRSIKNEQDKFHRFFEFFISFLRSKYSIPLYYNREEIIEKIKDIELSEEKKQIIYDILDFLNLVKERGFSPDNKDLNDWINRFENLL